MRNYDIFLHISFSKSDYLNILITLFGEFIISSWLYCFLGVKTTHESWDAISLLVYLNLGDVSVHHLPIGLFGDSLSFFFIFEAHISSSSKISLFKSIKLHSMASQDMVRETSLIELYIFLKVFVFLLVK